jgi:hypothetical protein
MRLGTFALLFKKGAAAPCEAVRHPPDYRGERDVLRGTLASLASILLSGSGAAVHPAAPPDWIAGHWCTVSGGQVIEELWLPPHGGVAIGVGRTRTGEATTAFEYLRILEVDGVLSYVAQPGGNPPTVFRQVAGGDHWIRFENPAHDFPTRVEYRREGDALHAEIAGPGEDGEEQVVPFDYRRCDRASS